MGNYFIFHWKTKLLIVVLGPVSVVELISVEDALSVCCTCYERKINILTCLCF